MPGQRSSFRTQLFLFLFIMLVPAIGALAYAEYRLIQADLRGTEEGLLSQADAASLSISEFLSNSERILERLAADPDIRSLDPGRCPAYFPALGRIFIPTYTNLFTWTQGEVEICSTLDPTGANLSVGRPPGMEEIKAAEGFHISRVHQGTSSGKWTTGLSYPLRNDEGRKVGTITLSVDLVHFQEILGGLQPSPDGIVSVMEGEGGTVVARSRESEIYVGQSPLTPDAVSRDDPSFSRRGTSRANSFDGVEHLWGFVQIPNTPWMVYAGRPADTIYGPMHARWIRSGLLALTAIVLVLLLGRVFYARITRPLAELEREAAAANPLDSNPLSIQGPREVARVAMRFNEAWEAWGAAEAGRRQSMERIRSLVENAVTGIYISNESGRFLEVNQAMVDLLGFESREELMETPVSSLYSSVQDRLETLASHGHKDFFQGLEAEWIRKDGGPVHVRLFGRRFESPRGEKSWEVIVEDVTKLRNLQEQYLQAQKMEALGRLAGGIAHDFNNLLTVVQGQAGLILEEPTLGEELKAQIREIADAAERGAELNRQLLAFGRKGKRLQEKLDLNNTLKGFELVLRRAVGEEIDLILSMGTDLGWIRGDRGQLEQVLMNLVVNARDAMPRGGHLRIETFNAELDEQEAAAFPPAMPGPHVVLAVTDTGSGMDPALLSNIFEPFFTTKPESKGSGLGLSTVYGIVTELGGHIRVDSVPGEGTTFQLFFPLTIPPVLEERPPAPRAEVQTGSGLILLAEDEEAVRRLTTRILERAGYQVLAARDGAEALEMARAHEGTLDLLLTDVVMPELRGPDLAEILAREGKVKRVVLFSGYPEGLKDTGLKGPTAWELLPKPFSSRDLLAAVGRAFAVGD